MESSKQLNLPSLLAEKLLIEALIKLLRTPYQREQESYLKEALPSQLKLASKYYPEGSLGQQMLFHLAQWLEKTSAASLDDYEPLDNMQMATIVKIIIISLLEAPDQLLGYLKSLMPNLIQRIPHIVNLVNSYTTFKEYSSLRANFTDTMVVDEESQRKDINMAYLKESLRNLLGIIVEMVKIAKGEKDLIRLVQLQDFTGEIKEFMEEVFEFENLSNTEAENYMRRVDGIKDRLLTIVNDFSAIEV